MKKIILILAIIFISLPAYAELKKKIIEYKQGDTALEGYLVYDTKFKGNIPTIIVFHDWMGLEDYAKHRADMLAQLGYVAFAADIYGKGVRPHNTQEASQQATFYKNDRTLLRARALAALEEVKKYHFFDPTRVAAIGYCFGGTTALELARSGVDLKGVVSFHGGLSTPHPESTKDIKPKILALHGADDPYVKPDEVAEFQKEMNNAKADWQMIYYSGAVHSFTRPDAGNDNSKGAAYNEKADKRSWEAMKQFFKEIFK